MQTKGFKDSLQRGFTLIELMIVIVILGVLMGTILPRLTGAQARARDTGRIADMNTIAQALETYFDDFGKYPGTNGTGECLENSAGSGSEIKTYLKGNKVPLPPLSAQKTTISGRECEGKYYYAPIKSKGLNENGYVIISDVETFSYANLKAADLTVDAALDTTKIGALLTEGKAALKILDDADASSTVYILFN